jgi:hypothetical protein
MDYPNLLKTDHFSPRYLLWHNDNAQRSQRLRAELGGLLRLYDVAFRPPRRSFWAVLLGAQASTPSSSGKMLKAKGGAYRRGRQMKYRDGSLVD